MFGLFKKKTTNDNNDAANTANSSNVDTGLKSWHYSPDENKMVPCATTPCNQHGDTDVMAANEYFATMEINQRISARYGIRARYTGDLNPNTVFPDDYEQFALFRDNKYAELVSFNTIYVGNLRYAPAVKKWYWRNDAYSDYTINFAKRCEYCHGTGLVNEKMCSNCGGKKYSAKCSASPSDMVLIQDVKGADDKKFHDFVKQYPDDFNEYMRHVIIANTYLANDGEKALYSQELKKNFKNEVVNDQNAFLRRMRSLKYNYDEMMKNKDSHIINTGTIMIPAPLYPNLKIGNKRLTIVSSHVYNDKKTGEKKAILYCRNEKTGEEQYSAYKIFTSYNAGCIPGNMAYISSAYLSSYDADDSGRPYLKLRNAKVSIYNKGEI
ncbi:hypothetical protein EMO92_09310 [Bifidobacterium reuteri]|uniref:Uncharacterized protein n=1 Tax=Bifidobacterium reuteri TaxID=983706 RepID=A0A5J5E4X9_9BIFI|nr:hypothetical protein [Bifidobacterium reuteri]KAA8823996.1 hypothetical protein EMO92_09310 [Bifidobacterium reuteri]